MNYPLYQMLIIFAIYSIMGWIAEAFAASLRNEGIFNKGILRGAYCPVYGIGALLLILEAEALNMNVPQIFIAGLVTGTVVEFVSWLIIKGVSGVKIWKCHQAVTWGVFALIAIVNIKPAVMLFIRVMPLWVHFVFLAFFFLFFTDDAIDSIIAIVQYRKNIQKLRAQNIRPGCELSVEAQDILEEYQYLMQAYPYFKKDMRRRITN